MEQRPLRTCLQPKQHWSNTSKEPCCRPASTGTNQPHSSKKSLSSARGDGIRTLPARLGNHTGLLLQTQVQPAPFFSCRGRCKCSKAGVRCTSICACEGACTNNDGGDDEWSSNCVHVRDTMTTRIHERDHETKPAVFHVVAFFVMLSNPSFNSFGLFGFIIL